MSLPSALMGKQTLSPKVSGKIRPGIQILTKAGKENPRAVAIYNDGVAKGNSYEDIEDRIYKELDLHALRPVNTPFFTVRRGDFGGMPELADLILNKYGEVRDDKLRRLYRFPVVFGADEIPRILNFNFQMYSKSGIQYWSGESSDGQTRTCNTFAPIAKAGSKAVRLVAGRDIVPRPDNQGICAPNQCPEFQEKKCTMRGRLLFYIPGVPGGGLIELPTGSKNFGVDSETVLNDIFRLGGGRIPTLIDGKPVFYITKRLRNVPMIDYEQGKATRTDQWIIEIEADLDMSRLRVSNAPLYLVGNAGTSAATLSGSQPNERVVEKTPSVGRQEPVVNEITGDKASLKQTHQQDKKTDPHAGIKALRAELAALLEANHIDAKSYAAVAAKKWGDVWSRSESSVKQAIEEIKALSPRLKNIRANLKALGIEFDKFDIYAKGAFSEHWQFDPQMLPGIEDEVMNAFPDRVNYVAAVLGVVDSVSQSRLLP
ncbi:MAG: hypothetical protein WAO76_09140 [Georgfuchsia sp.]